MNITGPQLTRLQTCCSHMATRVAGFENSRPSRLAWASSVLKREVSSFKNLTMQEGRRLIDAAQGEIGHRAPLKPASKRLQRPVATTEEAMRAGLDGRNIDTRFVNAPQLVNSEQIETIASYRARLGWSQEQFEAWLSTKRSPLRGRKTIVTFAQANKVRWALKGMLQAKGLWVDWSAT